MYSEINFKKMTDLEKQHDSIKKCPKCKSDKLNKTYFYITPWERSRITCLECKKEKIIQKDHEPTTNIN